MNVLKETQLTLRASRRPVEYNYTNSDVEHITSTSPYDGYQFEYPVNWTGDPSTKKVIGIRRISYKPTSVNPVCQIELTNSETTINLVYTFTEQNTFEEIINMIVVDINSELTKQQSTGELPTRIQCVLDYDKDNAKVKLKFIDILAPTNPLPFVLYFPIGSDSEYNGTDAHYKADKYIHYKAEFLKLFNQPITKANIDKIHSYTTTPINELSYDNVWNRDTFYCHASFSDSPKQIIGINKDFWPAPSVFYDYSDNSNDFNIYFTTDTQHRILPRNGVMLIQLSYIFNYQTSMLTYA